jgi:hypothetical protein
MTISKKIKKNNKCLSRRQFGGKDCKFPDIWENENTCVRNCPSGKFSKFKSSKFICDNLGGSNGMRFTDLSDDRDKGQYYGPIDEKGMPTGLGLMVYDEGPIYYGEHQNGIRTRGIQLYPDGMSFEGQFDRNGGIQGTLTTNKLKMIGTFVNGFFNGKGTAIENGGVIIEGDFEDNKFIGNGTITMPNGRVYNYPKDEHLFLTPMEYHRSQFIIQQPDMKKERHSITFLIMLHGADIANSRCHYNTQTNTVRLVSPVKSDDPNKVYNENNNYLIDAYHIATNVFHLEENQKASSLQKLQKTVELFNLKSGPDHPVFPRDSIVNPLMDHLYKKHGVDVIPYAGIYVIYDSKNDAKPFERFPETTEYDFSNAKKLKLDSDEILRSDLINRYILNYGIINIIDLSCRPRLVGNLADNTANRYSCRYTTANPSDPEESPIL